MVSPDTDKQKELFSDNREGRRWSIPDYKLEADPNPTNIPLLGLFQYRSDIIIDERPFRRSSNYQ